MVYKTTRTEDKAIETVGWIELLQGVEQSGDDIMSTWSLTTTKDNAYIHLLRVGTITRNKLYERHAVGVREELLDLFLIVNTLSWFTLLHRNCALQGFWQFGLIRGSRNLQSTFFHNLNRIIISI